MTPRIDSRPSLTDLMVEAVRDAIQAKTLVPGEIYSVYQVAELFGVSRSPVREALVRLAEAGVVEFSRNRGFRVRLPQARDIAEIFAVRLALEPAAAARFSADASPDAVQEVVETMRLLEQAAAAADAASFWPLDRMVHRLVLVGAGNTRAAAIVDSLRATTGLLQPPTSSSVRSLTQICAEHAPIVDAIEHRDGSAARRAMSDHLTATGLLLVGQALGVTPDDEAALQLWDTVVGQSDATVPPARPR